MSVLDRISTLLKSNINALLSDAEDPEMVLDQILRDMRKHYREAYQQVQTSIADEKILNNNYTKERRVTEEWHRKAVLALKQNREDLAREALTRKQEHEQLAMTYLAQLEKQSAMVEQLKRSLVELDRKIDEANRKKPLIIARKKRAEAQKSITTMMSKVDDRSAFEAFARLEEKVEALEAEAEAAEDMLALETTADLEKEFQALEAGGDVEHEMLALKASLGMSVPELESAEVTMLPEPPDETEIESLPEPPEEEEAET